MPTEKNRLVTYVYDGLYGDLEILWKMEKNRYGKKISFSSFLVSILEKHINANRTKIDLWKTEWKKFIDEQLKKESN